jgi:hypothetical protein
MFLCVLKTLRQKYLLILLFLLKILRGPTESRIWKIFSLFLGVLKILHKFVKKYQSCLTIRI